ncbi:MAG: DUF4190 domain-containing protein [Planctomycetes bacterium]|nr:DUF4190 domain-containing protein [Planctomycetota bacterium]MBL7038539.1 DUF4190 domain-containing protein [Pirellulaceae bacterium]
MSDNHEQHIGLSPAEEENVLHYRSVSRIAVISLLLGLLSFTAIFSPVLWCVPIVGVMLAVVALRTIRKEQAVVVGRGAAQVGLALGLVFLTFAATRDFVRQRALYRLARPHTSKWVDELVREGHLHEAHQLHLPQRQRQTRGEDIEAYYEGDEDARRDMQAFFETPPLSKIVELGRRGTLRFVADEDIGVYHDSGEKIDVVVQRYAIDYEADGQPQTLSFLVSISRKYDTDHDDARWQIQDVTKVDSAGR